jgi:hypothetical protein
MDDQVTMRKAWAQDWSAAAGSDEGVESEEVVAGMLAREVVIALVEQHAFGPARIADDRGAEFGAVESPHDERADGVGAVVDADGEGGRGSLFHESAAAGRGFRISK